MTTQSLIVTSAYGRSFVIEPVETDRFAYTVIEPDGRRQNHEPMDYDEAKDLLAWDLSHEHQRCEARAV